MFEHCSKNIRMPESCQVFAGRWERRNTILSIPDFSGFCGKLLFPNRGLSDKIRHNLWPDMKPREVGMIGQNLKGLPDITCT
jgi:hypothetical protein